jgi:hypothetical protein
MVTGVQSIFLYQKTIEQQTWEVPVGLEQLSWMEMSFGLTWVFNLLK